MGQPDWGPDREVEQERVCCKLPVDQPTWHLERCACPSRQDGEDRFLRGGNTPHRAEGRERYTSNNSPKKAWDVSAIWLGVPILPAMAVIDPRLDLYEYLFSV